MNRYSRIVTQPKSQGASQVCLNVSRRGEGLTGRFRPCYTQQTVLTLRKT